MRQRVSAAGATPRIRARRSGRRASGSSTFRRTLEMRRDMRNLTMQNAKYRIATSSYHSAFCILHSAFRIERSLALLGDQLGDLDRAEMLADLLGVLLTDGLELAVELAVLLFTAERSQAADRTIDGLKDLQQGDVA